MATDIREELARLKKLKDIDFSIYQLHRQIENLPQSMADIETAYHAVSQAFEEVTTQLAEAERAKYHEEHELEATLAHLKEREARLYSIKTQHEYQAAIKEVAEAKRLNKEREERILVLMEQVETLGKKKEQLTPEFADKEASYKAKLAEVKAREEELRLQLQKVESERPALAASIEKIILRKYDFIRKHYPDAFVPIVRGTCSGCHMHIPPQLSNEIHHFVHVKSCPSCTRLLYLEEDNKEEGS